MGQKNTIFSIDAEDYLALQDALETAVKQTEAEMQRQRSKPYTRALAAQVERYKGLQARLEQTQ